MFNPGDALYTSISNVYGSALTPAEFYESVSSCSWVVETLIRQCLGLDDVLGVPRCAIHLAPGDFIPADIEYMLDSVISTSHRAAFLSI